MKINDYVTDDDIVKLVEEGLTYKETAEKINDMYGVNFKSSTIGSHYRQRKEEIGERINCDNCGKYFYISDGYNTRFCSEECYENHLQEVYPEEVNEEIYIEEPEQEVPDLNGPKEPWHKRFFSWLTDWSLLDSTFWG